MQTCTPLGCKTCKYSVFCVEKQPFQAKPAEILPPPPKSPPAITMATSPADAPARNVTESPDHGNSPWGHPPRYHISRHQKHPCSRAWNKRGRLKLFSHPLHVKKCPTQILLHRNLERFNGRTGVVDVVQKHAVFSTGESHRGCRRRQSGLERIQGIFRRRI